MLGAREATSSLPPSSGSRSQIETSCPRRRAILAASIPAGPLPTTITRRGEGAGSIRQVSSRPTSGLTAQRASLAFATRSTQALQEMQGRISASLPSCTLRGKSGSAMSARPIAIRSASPSVSTCSASEGSSSLPTAMTGMLTERLIVAASETRKPRGRNIGPIVWWSAYQLPAETLIAQTPASSSSPHTAAASSTSNPPSAPSAPLIRYMTGYSAPQRSRTAATISSGKRARFSSGPPYSSVRRFERGEMNSHGR